MSRHIRWQATLALLGVLLVVALLSYAAYSYTSELVPARGGVYVEGVAGNPQYVNPVLCQYNEIDRDLCPLIFSGLLRFDEHGEVQPDLAESWEASPASDVFTFTLRADARWHDGLRITADDVIFTVEMMQDPNLPVLYDVQKLWQSIIAEKVDERTVVCKLPEPFAPFPDYTTIRWFGVLPKHYWQRYSPRELTQAQLNTQPIGSGPFRVTEFDAQHIRLEPNPRSFQRPPYLDALEFRFFPDHASIFAAAQAGEINGVSRILPEFIEQAEDTPNLQLFTSPLPGYSLALLNLNTPNAPFFADVNVRKALAYALDRQRLIDDVIPGGGVLADSPILPGTWAYNPNTPKIDYDPTTAKRLLDEAGWIDTDNDGIRDKDGKPFEFILLVDDAPNSLLLAQSMAADWAQVGVNVIPQQVPITSLITDFLVPRNFTAALVNWELIGDPDPYPLWHSTQTGADGQNYSGWSNRAADIAMEEARRTTDRERRRQLYGQFQQAFAEDLPAILLYYPLYTYGVTDNIEGAEMGLLNEPADRFQSFAQWYTLTRRAQLAERRTLKLDNAAE